MSVTAELLGLPPDRSWVDPPLGGAYLPGATVELRAGLDHGVAAPRLSLIFELRRTGEVVARTQLEVTVISPSRPIELALRLPETPGTTYELVLDVAGECVSWESVVPEQRVDACFEFERQVVRRGELLRASIRNGAIALDTGVAYGFERWNGVDWVHVDPVTASRAPGRRSGWAFLQGRVGPSVCASLNALSRGAIASPSGSAPNIAGSAMCGCTASSWSAMALPSTTKRCCAPGRGWVSLRVPIANPWAQRWADQTAATRTTACGAMATCTFASTATGCWSSLARASPTRRQRTRGR